MIILTFISSFSLIKFQILAIENDPLLGPIEKEQRKLLVLYGGHRGKFIGLFQFS